MRYAGAGPHRDPWCSPGRTHQRDKTEAPVNDIDVKKGDNTVKEPKPAYDEWFAWDQQVLGFIFASVSKEVLGQIAVSLTTAEAWAPVAAIFVVHTRACSVNVCLALATTKKGAMSVTEHVSKM
jgi:hypothetical protein